MKTLLLTALASLSLAGCASTQQTALVEQGYERGALGVNAIARGDWDKAEALLAEKKGVRADDPALLINLGRVYLETNRPALALAAWEQAAASPHHYLVETGSGRQVSTAALAREALERHGAELRIAAREGQVRTTSLQTADR
jgi:hypothetical protein